jgi:hypothetical protein
MRDNETYQRDQAQRVQDTRIEQKVMAAHREAFAQKFPGQVEHCMRLIAERLQTGLRKDQPVELMASEIADLSQALNLIYSIHCNLKD